MKIDYRLTHSGDSIIVHDVRDFNLKQTLECGQCFRWIRQSDGSYTGVASGRALNIRQITKAQPGRMDENPVMSVESADSNVNTCDLVLRTTEAQFRSFWYDYFDLGLDYGAIKNQLKFDSVLQKPMTYGSGIRLLRQNIWEVLVSFIISANNRIPMIMKVVDNLSRMYGKKVEYFEEMLFSFPDVEDLANAELCELQDSKGGFRCKYIKKASQMIQDAEIDLGKLNFMDTDEARNELMKLPGVGGKVADCILLYSGTKFDVFPSDVWVKRVMKSLYFFRDVNEKEIRSFTKSRFGEYSGHAQQYLFNYAREFGIGK